VSDSLQKNLDSNGFPVVLEGKSDVCEECAGKGREHWRASDGQVFRNVACWSCHGTGKRTDSNKCVRRMG
jgi:DnaJ-class molecular chaperone